jgi:peptide/nickel transport system substrate-binding protein
VRQAISYGLNRQRIIDNLLFSKAKPGSSELVEGFFSCPDVKPYPFELAKAKQLLEAAGWKPGSDGIRVKDGQRLRLKFQTTSGNKLREDSQVLMSEDMRAIGIELFIENAPSSVVLGTWESGAAIKRGNFDIEMHTTGPVVDAHGQMFALWHSTQIPTEKFKSGTNITRFNNPNVDELLDKASLELDPKMRRATYCRLAQTIYDDASTIYLYARNSINSQRVRVQGNVAGNIWRNIGWDAHNWWVNSSN